MTNTNYKPGSIDKAQITAAARQALMAADAHYYAWPIDQQERFRSNMGRTSRVKVQRVLLNSLLSIQCSDEKVDEAWGDVPMPELNMLNWASLLTSGIGEDYLYLNESMAEGKSLLDYTTLYDYDYDDHLFQEKARYSEFSNYEGADYYAYRHASWVRLLVNEQFYYATFLSLASHVAEEVEEVGNGIIGQLIPHKYIDGKDNGKPEKGGFLWDMQLDAGGQEGQLDELRSRWYSYVQERRLTLSKGSTVYPAAVYTQEIDWDEDPHLNFIFNNETALKKIRWRYFLSDCEPLLDSYSTVASQLEQEINNAKAFLTKSHKDIQVNFDPDVIKWRKKKKVIMTAGALNDLKKMSSEDEPKE